MLRKQKIWNNFKNNKFENLNRQEAKELAGFTFEPNAGGLTETWNSRSPDNNWVQRLDNSATPSLISHILFFFKFKLLYAISTQRVKVMAAYFTSVITSAIYESWWTHLSPLTLSVLRFTGIYSTKDELEI